MKQEALVQLYIAFSFLFLNLVECAHYHSYAVYGHRFKNKDYVVIHSSTAVHDVVK